MIHTPSVEDLEYLQMEYGFQMERPVLNIMMGNVCYVNMW